MTELIAYTVVVVTTVFCGILSWSSFVQDNILAGLTFTVLTLVGGFILVKSR